MRRVSYVVVAVVASTLLTTPARAADGGWSPLRATVDHTLAVALDAGTTALISIGGPDGATVHDQRVTAGVEGPRTEVLTIADAEDCRPVEAVTALGNLAVAVECRASTGLEDPPTRLAELVWTGDDGWVSRVLPEGELASLDYSPQGQFVVFASNSGYGRPHHVTSYHADLGWRDLTRRELGPTGDDLVAAIDDRGRVVTLRGSGFEDEPGYWFGGRLRIESYRDGSGTWTVLHDRAYRSGGIAPGRIDLAAGRIVAAVVESRSTGRLRGRADRVLVLGGDPADPDGWAPRRWSHEVLDASAEISQAGVGVAVWQTVDRRTARARLATWAPGRGRPSVRTVGGGSTLTDATTAGRALDVSVSADGHGVVARARHRPGADRATVTATSFVVAPTGRLRQREDATWEQPVSATVEVAAGTGATAITIGRVTDFLVTSPLVEYAVRPWAVAP